MNTFKYILLGWTILGLWGCKDLNNKNDAFKPVSAVQVHQDRSEWQKPELVIKKLGDLQDKTIADIGAGTGYFTYRFALKGARCIATDIDPEMITLMELFKVNLPEKSADRIEIRKAEPDDSMLHHHEADIIFISNTVAYIDNLDVYLSNLKEKLKPQGRIFILDFKEAASGDFVPPTEERMPLRSLQNTLLASGYKLIEVDTTTLPEQYIVIAEVKAEKLG